MTTIDRGPISAWFKQLLERGTARPVFWADEIPPSPDYPFCTIHTLDGGGTWGGELKDPDANADFVYQVDAVGQRTDSSVWLGDAIHRTVLARDDGRFQVNVDPPAGTRVADRRLSGGRGGAIPEGRKTGSVVSFSERYLIRVVGV